MDDELWRRINVVAQARNCSASWISRYCVFRLAMRRVLKKRIALEIHSKRVKEYQKNSKIQHRHIICLYGEDEKLLRIAAMELQITVSHLVRMAIYWFLPKIENRQVTWPEIFYYGIKICRYLDISRRNELRMPFYDHIFYTKWPIEKWWRRPWHPILIPYSPGNKISRIYEYVQRPNHPSAQES